jgi:hypothetical protein
MLGRYPGTGEYNKTKDDGVYGCAACGTPLYKSTTKFDSGCGWPAFFEGIPGAITETVSAPLLVVCFSLRKFERNSFKWAFSVFHACVCFLAVPVNTFF